MYRITITWIDGSTTTRVVAELGDGERLVGPLARDRRLIAEVEVVDHRGDCVFYHNEERRQCLR